MKLQHHLGGLEGLTGPIDFEKRVFVQDWERRIFGIHAAMMGLSSSLREAVPDYDLDAVPTAFDSTWTWADLRKGAEAMNPFAYFQYRYYEKWLGGITGYLVQHGYVDEAELAEATDRYRAEPAAALPERDERAIDDQVIRYLRQGDSPRRGPAEPAFAVGDRILVADPPAGEHTRLPGYLRGCPGTVARVFEGSYAYFCSTGADGLGEPVPVYAVRFEPADVWGETAEPNAGPVYCELYQTYLTPYPTPSQETAR
ncbi:MAG TPA: nitrile hydratase subunit beta [Pseudonocardia sp.]|jgi:nitrile hydratase|nr:nitrile hydratase subunit beta [Pseudonocardia sp.]